MAPHGNSKGHGRHIRTLPSTMTLLKEESEKLTPKLAVEAVDAVNGGIMEVEAAGSLPRNRAQVSNMRRRNVIENEKRRKNTNAKKDELAAVMEMCVNQAKDQETAFVRKVQCAPDTMCILATNHQLRELERNATNAAAFKIVSVDPTFNLGAFDVTVMTHVQGLVRSKRTGKHPVVMGPLLVHKQKKLANYYYFMSSLIELKSSLSGVKTFGTDGEKALQQGITQPCPTVKLVRCFGHFKTNLKEKLDSLDVPKPTQQEIIRDIFGYNVGETHYEGLVDSEDDDVFNAKLSSLEVF